MHRLVTCILSLACVVAHAAIVVADDPVAQALAIDAPMHTDPVLEGPPTRVEFDPRLKPLWLAALDRPEIDLRLQAAEAFAAAHTRGYADFSDVAPTLAAKFDRETHPLVRLALADTLIKLDAKAHADTLLAANQRGDRDMVLLTDPALARWKHAAAGEVWTRRAVDAAASPAVRVSALDSLAELADPRFTPALQTVALDAAAPAPLRLAAANAFSRIKSGSIGTYGTVERLHAGSLVDRLVGVAMMRSIGIDAPDLRLPLCLRYAADDSHPVAADALRQLIQIDPGAVLRVSPDPLTRDDAQVRFAAAQNLHAFAQSSAIAPLAALLDDHDPRTRRYARYALLQFDADAAKRDAVRAAAMDVLASAGWRGLEQAALLLGKLDHEPAAGRLVELLTHERVETRVAAAVALRWLAVPDTFPAMLAHAQILSEDQPSDGMEEAKARSDQLVEIFQAFGVMGYAAGEPLMKTYIAKSLTKSPQARATAIWALGKLHAGDPQKDLVSACQSRLNDTNPMNPEATEVRSAAAVALGRMKAKGAESMLRRYLKEENASREIGGACRWALEQITGDAQPPLDTLVERPMDWFLRPAE